MSLFLTILSVAAFALAAIALSFSIAVARQSGAVAAALERHRLAHSRRDGQADPGSWDGGERRRLNLGPPRATGERRRRESPPEPPEQLTVDDAPTGEREAASVPLAPRTSQIRRQLPRPGEIGRQR
jgi:hypothetical protein